MKEEAKFETEKRVELAKLGHLFVIGIRPDCQSRGYGKALIRHKLAEVCQWYSFFNHCVDDGLQWDRLGLSVVLECIGEKTIKLYESLGFRTEAELPVLTGEGIEIPIVMSVMIRKPGGES